MDSNKQQNIKFSFEDTDLKFTFVVKKNKFSTLKIQELFYLCFQKKEKFFVR